VTDLAQTLADRKSIHGDFTDHARISQALKDAARESPSWPVMSAIQRESVDMILHKIARVCAGNPAHPDHWHDIAGYARLVEERLPSSGVAS
jgi:hypothetical protein